MPLSRSLWFLCVCLATLSLEIVGRAAACVPDARIVHGQSASEALERELAALVADAMRADYGADLDGLLRAADAFGAHIDHVRFGAPARYWRGFALSCSALARVFVLEGDRSLARDELLAAIDALESVPAGAWRADALALASGCLGNLAFLRTSDDPEPAELSRRARELLDDAVLAEPENPRVLWILGGVQLFSPESSGGGRARALATYSRGLELARRPATAARPQLAPTWGEAELLSSLAFAHSTVPPLDLAAAEEAATAALQLEPEWVYVRDRLLPRIREARAR